MSLFNHIIGFRSKNSQKMTIATLYYISGGVFSSGFEDKWFGFLILIILFPVFVFAIKDIFAERSRKSVIKVLVCSIIILLAVYILQGMEKVTNESLVQREVFITESKEKHDGENSTEQLQDVENEVKKIEFQETEKIERTVYKGKTGNKYHKSDCGTLKGKGIQMPYEEAIKEGREACKICKP